MADLQSIELAQNEFDIPTGGGVTVYQISVDTYTGVSASGRYSQIGTYEIPMSEIEKVNDGNAIVYFNGYAAIGNTAGQSLSKSLSLAIGFSPSAQPITIGSISASATYQHIIESTGNTYTFPVALFGKLGGTRYPQMLYVQGLTADYFRITGRFGMIY